MQLASALAPSTSAVGPTSGGESVVCRHCNARLSGDCDTAPFCCTGCRLVFGLLTSQHLDRYYELRGVEGVAVQEAQPERRDLKWLEALDANRSEQGDIARIDVDVQGLHCSACVWLIETLFRRSPGAVGITVNPAVGRAQFLIGSAFPLQRFVREVERFGYLFGPALKKSAPRANGLLLRMGICIALAMNAMIFATAHYAGLTEGPVYVLFQRWSLALSVASVVVGGSVFFRSAWFGVRQRVLHLDLPIAVGIALAFGGSLYAYANNRSGGIFTDTLDVFIALMLVGRFLQERVLERNRLALLENDGVDGLLSRRQDLAGVTTVRCSELRRGDRILLAPGDLVPLDATLATAGESASFSLDWINGESHSRTFTSNERLPAGAFLTGMRAVTIEATQDFEESPLPELLRTPLARAVDAAMSTSWWHRLAKVYVVAVLAASAVGFVAWFAITHDLARSLEVTTAVLIVTCPCAFGIATPLGYDLAQAGLRRAGLYVRSAGFLDRAAQVRTVVFDKTGTLTTGALRVADTAPLETLTESDQRLLASIVVTSNHPKSAAIHRALVELGVACAPARDVSEVPGLGLAAMTEGGREVRVGARRWAAGGEDAPESAQGNSDVVFACDGKVLAELTTEESLRPDARTEVAALRGAGYDVWLLSGDDSARVAQTARVAGVPLDHAVGGASAEGKAAWAAAHDRGDLLMIGDGINDSLVVAQAFCSGTPAIDRPFMAARSDFYFVTPGLAPIGLALRVASRVAHVRRRNLALAVAYNVLAVSLAYAGLMSPLVCAVLMPASSLTTILATTFSLSSRSALWRS